MEGGSSGPSFDRVTPALCIANSNTVVVALPLDFPKEVLKKHPDQMDSHHVIGKELREVDKLSLRHCHSREVLQRPG